MRSIQCLLFWAGRYSPICAPESTPWKVPFRDGGGRAKSPVPRLWLSREGSYPTVVAGRACPASHTVTSASAPLQCHTFTFLVHQYISFTYNLHLLTAKEIHFQDSGQIGQITHKGTILSVFNFRILGLGIHILVFLEHWFNCGD